MFDGQGASQPKATIADVQSAVSAAYRLSIEDLKGKSKKRHIAWPRQKAFALCRELTSASLAKIGHAFGGRDHATIIVGCRVALGRCRQIESEANDMRLLRERIIAVASARPAPPLPEPPRRMVVQGRPWTHPDVATLNTLWREGKSPKQIAPVLRRSAGTIRHKARKLGLPSFKQARLSA